MADDIDQHDFRLPSERASGRAFNPAMDDNRYHGEIDEHDFLLPSEKQKLLLTALRQQKATWQEDGLGIRGTAEKIINTSANLSWPSSGVTRRASPEVNQGDISVAAQVITEA